MQNPVQIRDAVVVVTGAASGIGEAMGGVRDLFPSDTEERADMGEGWGDDAKRWAKDPWAWVIFGFPLFIVMGLRTGAWRRLWAWLRRQDGADVDAVGRLYAEMLAALARLGLPRGSSETPREFLVRVRQSGAPFVAEVTLLTAMLERVRYEGASVSEAQMDDAISALQRLRAARWEPSPE